jgi:guanylate kinase
MGAAWVGGRGLTEWSANLVRCVWRESFGGCGGQKRLSGRVRRATVGGMSEVVQRTGFLCVVSGPSGSGKTTLCRKAREVEGCAYSVSCTTRAPRPGEVEGHAYHFVNQQEFFDRTLRGEFLEWARVHGHFYGTLRSEVTAHLEAGRDVLLDIDVQGAGLVRACDDPFLRRSLVDVFILPPNLEELRQRLAGRGTESEDQLRLRMYNALEEMRHWREYRYAIVSGTPEEDLQRFRDIIRAERLGSARMRTPAGLLADGARLEDLPDLRPAGSGQDELPLA